ncbi:aminotransferase DegT [Nitrospira sp.]|nr:aminotransferase DegT [Nitrospira sp.]
MSVVRAGRLVQGQVVAQFERAVADWFGRRAGVAVSSGTVALELAMRAMDIRPGDEVIMPSYVCAAPWQACTRVGATPVIADIDRTTYNLDPESARRLQTTRTKAIVVPHLFGLSAETTQLAQLGIPLIEDCAQTLDAEAGGRKVGTTGLVTICSFYATKPLCAGEGGMVLSDDVLLLERVRRLREYDEALDLTAGATNAKMTELHAAIGLAQLSKLPAFMSRRRAIAARYRKAWASLPLTLPASPPERTHDYFRFVVEAQADRSGPDAGTAWLETCTQLGLHCRRPIFQPLHRYLGDAECPHSEAAARAAISIPLYPALTDKEVSRVIQLVQETCHEVAQF